MTDWLGRISTASGYDAQTRACPETIWSFHETMKRFSGTHMKFCETNMQFCDTILRTRPRK